MFAKKEEVLHFLKELPNTIRAIYDDTSGFVLNARTTLDSSVLSDRKQVFPLLVSPSQVDDDEWRILGTFFLDGSN